MIVSSVHLLCDSCKRRQSMPSDTPENVMRLAGKAGWRVMTDAHLCPTCIGSARRAIKSQDAAIANE